MEGRRTRVLLAKPGLDGHDRGIKVLALGLRDAGFDVIYTGLRQSVDTIAQTALEEDVQVVGLSILSGSHLPICKKMRQAMDRAGLGDRMWLVGGNIPDRDRPILMELGVSQVFPTGTPIDQVAEYIQHHLEEHTS